MRVGAEHHRQIVEVEECALIDDEEVDHTGDRHDAEQHQQAAVHVLGRLRGRQLRPGWRSRSSASRRFSFGVRRVRRVRPRAQAQIRGLRCARFLLTVRSARVGATVRAVGPGGLHSATTRFAVVAHELAAGGAVFEFLVEHRLARRAHLGGLVRQIDDARHLLERGVAGQHLLAVRPRRSSACRPRPPPGGSCHRSRRRRSARGCRSSTSSTSKMPMRPR